MNNTNELYLHFHIGRGGRFNNQGHKTFEGFENLQDLIRKNSNNLFEKSRNKQGRFCRKKLVDCNGNIVCDTPNSYTGDLFFDGDYDSDVVYTFAEIKKYFYCYYHTEAELFAKYVKDGGYIPSEYKQEVEEWVNEWFNK